MHAPRSQRALAQSALAAGQLSRMVIERSLARAQRALYDRNLLPDEWRAVTGVNQMRLYLTPDELQAIDEDLIKLLLEGHADRRTPSPDHPPEAERVDPEQLFAAGAPRREVGLEHFVALEAEAGHLVEEQAEHRHEVLGLEEIHVKRILEVGRRVGCDDECGPVGAQHARELDHVQRGVHEVLDDV